MYYNLLNMINKDDSIVFKKDFQLDNSQPEFEFLSDNYFNSYQKGDKAIVLVRMFSTIEVKLTSGRLITVPINDNIYEVIQPCIRSLQILQEYFNDHGDNDKYNIVSNEILSLVLDEALEQYDEYDNEYDEYDNEYEFYNIKQHLLHSAQKTLGTPSEEKGKVILQMLSV